MSIRFTTKTEGDLLEVVASGFDDSLAEVNAYGGAIVAAAVQAGARRVLCNELELTYKLSTIDLYDSAKFIATTAPHVARIAIVCRPDFAEDIRFWENTVVNQGLAMKGFHDLAQARAWLDRTGTP